MSQISLLDKVKLKATEISHEANCPSYYGEVKYFVQGFYDRDIPIILDKNAKQSGVGWDTVMKRPRYVTIKITGVMNMIWDLIHEYGHILDGYAGDPSKLPPQDQFEREKNAWAIGKEELEKHPKLLPLIESYNLYTEECLKTYRFMLLERYRIAVK